MKRVGWILLALGVVVLALETSIFTHVSWRGVRPNLMLVFAVTVGCGFGPKTGALVGAWAGLLHDTYFGRFLGVYCAAHLVAGYIAGLIVERVFRDYLWLPLAVAAGLTVVAESFALLLFRLLGVPVSLSSGFFMVIIPGAVLNGLLAPLMYLPLLHLRRRLTEESEDSADD